MRVIHPLPVILKRFESPDETRRFPRGRFEIVTIGGLTIGRATYEPGWRWSEPGRGAAVGAVALRGRQAWRDA